MPSDLFPVPKTVKTGKGFEALSLLRQLSTHPHILEKSGLSLFQVGRVVIPKSRHICNSYPCCWSSPRAGLSPACPWVLCVSEHSCCGWPRSAGWAGQGLSWAGAAGSGSVPPCHTHPCREPLSVSGVLAGGWTGTGGAPRVGREEPKLCKGCVGGCMHSGL